MKQSKEDETELGHSDRRNLCEKNFLIETGQTILGLSGHLKLNVHRQKK